MIAVLERWLTKTETAVIAAGTALAATLAAAQVALRYGFELGIYWAEEVVVYAIIWTAFAAASAAVRTNEHLCVEIIRMVVPSRGQRVVDRITAVIGVAAGAALAVLGAKLVMSAYDFEQQSPALELPMWLVYIIIPISGVLMAFRFALLWFFAPPKSHSIG